LWRIFNAQDVKLASPDVSRLATFFLHLRRRR
jgi:hypothetical protein